MAIDIRSWSPGYTARKNPAKLEPIAGASLEVSDFEMRGFRRRKGFASCVRRLSRRRMKKRRSNRWKSRMRDNEHVKRTLGDFHTGRRRCGLPKRLASCRYIKELKNSLCVALCQELVRHQIPSLQPRERHHGKPQGSSNGRSIVIIPSFGNRIVLFRRQRSLSYRRCARKEVLVQELVLPRAYGVAQRVAQDGIDAIRFGGRGGRAGGRRHVEGGVLGRCAPSRNSRP